MRSLTRMMMKMSNKTLKTRYRGFTLMEILAALLLVGLVLPAAMKGVSVVMVLASDSARRYEALDLAEMKLAEILVQEDWQSGSSSGTFEDEQYASYDWILEVSDWTTEDIQQINLSVTWQQRNRTRDITLTTLVYDSDS